jgi:hypothetical protein
MCTCTVRVNLLLDRDQVSYLYQTIGIRTAQQVEESDHFPARSPNSASIMSDASSSVCAIATHQQQSNNQTVAPLTGSFSILELPGEIRSIFHDFATTENREGARSDADWDESYLGLTRECRQIRAEFRPLYFRNVRFTFVLQGFEEFLGDFFRPMLDTTKSRVLVYITPDDVLCGRTYDVLALLMVKEWDSEIQWEFQSPWNLISYGKDGWRQCTYDQRLSQIFKNPQTIHLLVS